jgi:hypothetical protein
MAMIERADEDGDDAGLDPDLPAQPKDEPPPPATAALRVAEAADYSHELFPERGAFPLSG